MLTRLKLDGFKNLVGVDVRFGPFTCVAGANGTGKSNLFDAIRFLSLTASHPLLEAAQRVRDEVGRNSDVRSLFHRVGNKVAKKITFEAEMIVPAEAQDGLGQSANAVRQFLRYKLEVQLRESTGNSIPQHPLEITKEELTIATGTVQFPFLQSARLISSGGLKIEKRGFDRIFWKRIPPPREFVATEVRSHGVSIKLRSEGRRTPVNQAISIRPSKTLLSEATAVGSPTAFCARNELESWQLLQLDPGALRQPDDFNAPSHLASNGRHLAATLARLVTPPMESLQDAVSGEARGEKVLARLANRLAGLVTNVGGLRLDRDEKRLLNTVLLRTRDGTEFPARALSDGTLRLLALALLELDPEAPRLICLEEPENGIHPDRIPAILQLLQDIAVDPMEPLDDTNLMRQVIVNTHSPSVVMAVPEDSLVVARSSAGADGERVFNKVEFAGLPGTWRSKAAPEVPSVSKGEVLSYLDPAGVLRAGDSVPQQCGRVVDRPELRALVGE